MQNSERLLYQNNNTGYNLVILHIVLNTIYTIFVLNVMDKDQNIGIFVMLSIVLLLLGFLMAIKVRIYSLSWSFIAILVGVFQISRLFFTINNTEDLVKTLLNIALVLSGVLSILGGIISVIKTKLRKSLK